MKTAAASIRIPTSAATYAAGLEGLTRINERLIQQGNFPPLYRSAVRYKREPRDVWRHIGDVFKSGWGDCEDLAAARSAQLRASGEDPAARVKVYKSGPNRYHAIVERGDGTTEDPSRKLGMKPFSGSPMGTLEGTEKMPMNVEKRARRQIARQVALAARRSRRRKIRQGSGAFCGVGADPIPSDRTVSFDIYKSGRGWSGIVRLPIKGGDGQAAFLHTSTGPSKSAAAAKTINLATRAMGSPLLKAVIPPQAALALNVLKNPLAQNLAKNVLKKFW